MASKSVVFFGHLWIKKDAVCYFCKEKGNRFFMSIRMTGTDNMELMNVEQVNTCPVCAKAKRTAGYIQCISKEMRVCFNDWIEECVKLALKQCPLVMSFEIAIGRVAQQFEQRKHRFFVAFGKTQCCCCAACGKHGVRLRCGQCNTVRYCDEICNKKGWPEHKDLCKYLSSIVLFTVEK